MLPAQSRRCYESGHHGTAESQRRYVPHPYEVEWKVDAAHVDRADEHPGTARGESVETHPGRGESRGRWKMNDSRRFTRLIRFAFLLSFCALPLSSRAA